MICGLIVNILCSSSYYQQVVQDNISFYINQIL